MKTYPLAPYFISIIVQSEIVQSELVQSELVQSEFNRKTGLLQKNVDIEFRQIGQRFEMIFGEEND